MTRRLLLSHHQSPGDVVVATRLVADLKLTYGSELELFYTGNCQEVFEHNPYITIAAPKDAQHIAFEYGAMIQSSNQRRAHFITAHHHDFVLKSGIPVKPRAFIPDLHFSPEELRNPLVSGKYWVIASGGKNDFTAKWWDHANWQRVVNDLRGEVQFVQVGSDEHYHPALDGVIDLRGKTSLRELMRLVLHSQGVCCVVTCLMHLAAGCNRPCVCVAGGREPWWWEAYTRKNRDANMRLIYPGYTPPAPEADTMVDHIYLHTIGQLECCLAGGCWKSTVCDNNACLRPVRGESIMQPECLTRIRPAQVVEAVRFYQRSGLCQLFHVPTAGQLLAKDEVKAEYVGYTADVLPVTICAMLHGPHVGLHRAFLESLQATAPKDSYRLRVGMHRVPPDIMQLLVAMGLNVEYVVKDDRELDKHVFMRELLWKQQPEKYVVWAEDDTIFQPDWIPALAKSIHLGQARKQRLFGHIFTHRPTDGQERWISEASWYRGVPTAVRGPEAAGEKYILYAKGGCWCCDRDVLQAVNWPDPRLKQAGGDIMLGAAVRQQGYNVGWFNKTRLDTFRSRSRPEPMPGDEDGPVGI